MTKEHKEFITKEVRDHIQYLVDRIEELTKELERARRVLEALNKERGE